MQDHPSARLEEDKLMEEVMTGIDGDPMQHEHKTLLFVGEWRIFAHCSCGWKTRTYARYYSPYLILTEIQEMIFQLTLQQHLHEKRMKSLKWRLKRAITEAWAEVSQKWGLGTK